MENKDNIEIRQALLEQRVTSLEDYQKRIENKLDKILDKLDREFVPRREYEQDLCAIRENHEEHYQTIRQELKGYKSSQLWQKIISTVATAIFVAIITYELTKK